MTKKLNYLRFDVDEFAKYARSISFILATCITLVIFLIPKIYAISVSENDADFVRFMASTVLYGPGLPLINLVNGEGVVGSIFDFVVSGGLEDEIPGLVTSARAIGALTVIAIALVRYFKELERDNTNWETGVKFLIEVCLVSMIIMNLDSILNFGAEYGQIVLDEALASMADLEEYTDGSVDELFESMNRDPVGSTWDYIFLVLILLIPFVFALLISLAMNILIIQILLEIGIYRLMAPIGIADIYGEGLRSPGVKYIKKYIGLFMKLAIAGLSCFICSKFNSMFALSSGTLGGLFTSITLYACVLGGLFKSENTVDTILGVH